MAIINRSALVLRGKQPFLDWINALPFADGEKKFTLEEVRRDPTVYLVADHDYIRDIEASAGT